MQSRSALCRIEETRHRALALAAPLPNVRGVAVLAAAAWAKEAAAAEAREARTLATQRIREAMIVANGGHGIDDRILSENPDRGFADGAGVGRRARPSLRCA